jgi:hypothetical protein
MIQSHLRFISCFDIVRFVHHHCLIITTAPLAMDLHHWDIDMIWRVSSGQGWDGSDAQDDECVQLLIFDYFRYGPCDLQRSLLGFG